jgi:hypothetical protein
VDRAAPVSFWFGWTVGEHFGPVKFEALDSVWKDLVSDLDLTGMWNELTTAK